jgi:hypothetical protein
LEGKVEKKIRLMVGCNLYNINPICYGGHMSMWYQLGKRTDMEVALCAPWRNPIDKARNMAAELALRSECDYLFFYDDDMYFFDGLVALKLLDKMIASKGTDKEIHILQAKAFIRGYPYNPMIFKKGYLDVEKTRIALGIYKDWEEHIDEDGLVKCDAVGCCATLIDCEVIRKIPKPYFMTGESHTEDVYFCLRCQTHLENVGIYMDTTVEVGHLLDNPVLCGDNIKQIIELHEKTNLGQIFTPDKEFVKKLQYNENQFKFVKAANPLEKFKEETENG